MRHPCRCCRYTCTPVSTPTLTPLCPHLHLHPCVTAYTVPSPHAAERGAHIYGGSGASTLSASSRRFAILPCQILILKVRFRFRASIFRLPTFSKRFSAPLLCGTISLVLMSRVTNTYLMSRVTNTYTSTSTPFRCNARKEGGGGGRGGRNT